MTAKGWIAGVLAVTVALVCIRLGFWQLDRLDQRREDNAAVAAATSRPALFLDAAAMAEIHRHPADYLYRRAVVEGVPMAGQEIVLRGRSHLGQPGVHLVTPLRLEGGGVVLINRGWVPSPDAATVDPREYRVAGPMRIEGMLQEMPPGGVDPQPAEVEIGDTSVVTHRRLSPEILPPPLAEALPPLYLQQTPGRDAGSTPPVPVPEPSLDEGPHLGYAVQWFSFGAIALFGFLFVAISRARRPA